MAKRKQRRGRRRKPRVLPGGRPLPDPPGLEAIVSAMHPALGYSPAMSAPRHHDDVYAHVARQIEQRFWSDVYVERPEIKKIFSTLETGQLVLITGERGTGKSTAIRAVEQEVAGTPDSRLLPFVFDANAYTEDLADKRSASRTIHECAFEHLDGAIEDRDLWFAHLYEGHSAFYDFRHAIERDGLEPGDPEQWIYLARQPEYSHLEEDGTRAFRQAEPSDRLRALLGFIGEKTVHEPLLVLDNVDHLDNEIACKCGEVLAAILQSDPSRIRAAIAVRQENADSLQSTIDTAVKPANISMQRPLLPDRHDNPSGDLTTSFVRKRLAVLKRPETLEVIIDAARPRGAGGGGSTPSGEDVAAFLEAAVDLLDKMIYDVFRTDEKHKELRGESEELARAVHEWHNGNLRECGLSLTMFVSDVLQNKDHMYELGTLLEELDQSPDERSVARRFRLRRITRSLLYRHLLFWSAPDREPRTPLKNVMIFDGIEESTDPPIHFLRLRILQYLANRQRNRASIEGIRNDFKELGVRQGRIDEALRELAFKRSQDDAGLVRIDGLVDVASDVQLRSDAVVQLLDPGRFLIERLYVTTEYLFWSAVTSPSFVPDEVPTELTPEHIQDDVFRTRVATSFLEHYLVERFCEEHPYLRTGVSRRWNLAEAHRRLVVYQSMFGFSTGNWFLNHVTASVKKFIPPLGPEQKQLAETIVALDRIQGMADTLDQLMVAAGA